MIPLYRVFDEYADDYDRWFDGHATVHTAQVRMLRDAVPRIGRGFEVGIGSGRFAAPLGIGCGIDPSRGLLRIAKNRGIEVVQGCGENLPFPAETFDYILMMTVVCFLDNPQEAFRETCRVLVPGGNLIVGFIEKDGEIAMEYLHEKTKGRFLPFARFRTADEIIRLYQKAGFSEVSLIKRFQGFSVMKGRKR